MTKATASDRTHRAVQRELKKKTLDLCREMQNHAIFKKKALAAKKEYDRREKAAAETLKHTIHNFSVPYYKQQRQIRGMQNKMTELETENARLRENARKNLDALRRAAQKVISARQKFAKGRVNDLKSEFRKEKRVMNI